MSVDPELQLDTGKRAFTMGVIFTKVEIWEDVERS